MKHIKMLGLLVMAAAALMAFASSASAAPVLTSPAGTDYTGEIHATLEGGTATLKAGIEDTCTESTAIVKVETNTAEHAAGPITEGGLTFGKCTQDTTVINPGRLTIDDKGTVFTEGSRVEVKVTSLGITCFYGAETAKVDIGTLTFGTPATLDVTATELQRESGSNTFFCAEKGIWNGKYLVTTPGTLLLT